MKEANAIDTRSTQQRITAAIALTATLAAATAHAEAAVCTNGRVSIIPSPLPRAAYQTFAQAAPGTKVYSYDIITVTDGKSSHAYLPTARISCDANGIDVTANTVRSHFPISAIVTSHSLRTWAIFPGLAPTGDEMAQLRLGRTRLVRTITPATAAAADAASPASSSSPRPSPTPKHKHFL